MSGLAKQTWDAICAETARGGDKTSTEIIDAAFVKVKEQCAAVALEFGNTAYRERNRQFTSKSRRELVVMQDTADSIARVISELELRRDTQTEGEGR